MARRILIDTSAIYALISAADDFHSTASNVYTDLLDRGDELYTTSYILVETSALVHRRLGFEPLKAFIHSIDGVFRIFWIDRLTHEDAWRRMVARSGAQLSFVDWSTVVVAEKIRSMIFTFDADFAREGLSVLPASVP